MQRLRNWFIGAVLIIVGAAVGYALPSSTVSPKSEVGEVLSVRGSIGSAGAGFTFKAKGATGSVRYRLEDPTPWQANSHGTWHSTGQPACLVPGSKKKVRVTLGVVKVEPVGSAPGNPTVVWIECYG
jgi:hypothetical protein